MKIEEQLLFHNDEIIVVNKPAGMLTIPDREAVPGVRNYLQQAFGTVFTVHRLDKDTSGVLVFARTEAMHKHLSQQFEARETRKIYNGLVLGNPAVKAALIDQPIAEHPVKKGMMAVYRKGKESQTEYEVLESFRLYSWMQFRILTGRTHQIRVHMKHIGHPIVCDELYGDGKPVLLSQLKSKFNLAKETEERPLLARLALHASQLEFKNLKGEAVQFIAPLPKDMKAVLQQLRKISGKA